MSTDITLRTSNSTRPVLDMLLPEFERATGDKVTLILDTAKNSLARIQRLLKYQFYQLKQLVKIYITIILCYCLVAGQERGDNPQRRSHSA